MVVQNTAGSYNSPACVGGFPGGSPSLVEALCNKKNSSDMLMTVVLSGMPERVSQAPLLLCLDSDLLSACLTQSSNIFPSASTTSCRAESEGEGGSKQ